MCTAYYAAERENALEKDREMEEGARAMAVERAAAEGGTARTVRAITRTITTSDGCQ